MAPAIGGIRQLRRRPADAQLDHGRQRAYDRRSEIGRLNQALEQARRDGWTVVDMARDWLVIHPPQPALPDSTSPAGRR